jgi:DNA polymerase III alpha subunit
VNNFTHLHTHSYYSLLDGILSPKKLASLASSYGMEALALTDHNLLTGAIEFYEACLEYGIKPILGLEVNIQHSLGNGNLILLCMDTTGWSNLCEISSLIHRKIHPDLYKGLPISILLKYTDGLICLSGGKRGLFYKLVNNNQFIDSAHYLQEMRKFFSDRFYIELQNQNPQDDEMTQILFDIGHRNNTPVVATNNVYFNSEDQILLHRTLCAIRLNVQISKLPPNIPAPEGSFFSNSGQMVDLYSDQPIAI